MPPQSHEKTVDGTTRMDLGEQVFSIAVKIARLDPGEAAALRRGPLSGAGTAAFWKLLADLDSRAQGQALRRWAALVQAIAILTPKGRMEQKPSAHDHTVPMGAALCQAGVSEVRLARMLSARGVSRCDHAIRVCRRLAATGPARFDLRALASFMLFDDDGSTHWIARTYYRAAAHK